MTAHLRPSTVYLWEHTYSPVRHLVNVISFQASSSTSIYVGINLKSSGVAPYSFDYTEILWYLILLEIPLRIEYDSFSTVPLSFRNYIQNIFLIEC